MTTWKEFWATKHRIYASQHHLEVHSMVLGQDLLQLLESDTPLAVLDYGCGDALYAPLLSAAGVRLFLFDPVPVVQERISVRFNSDKNVSIIDEKNLETFDHVFDVILLNSVLQYVPKSEFELLLPKFKHLLKNGGRLIISDVVSPKDSILRDIYSLVWSSLRYGFLFDALLGLFHTMFISNYRSVRKEAGFTSWEEAELIAVLTKHGFVAERIRPNIGLAPHRMMFVAKA